MIIREEMSSKFNIVNVCYPSEWVTNYFLLNNKKEFVNNWSLFSQRIWDDKKELYYLNVSQYSQFYDCSSGKTFRILNSKSKNNNSSKLKLLILSDPVNKKNLCKKYNYNCKCSSDKDILSKYCELNNETSILEGAKWCIKKLNYDGVVIKCDKYFNGKKNNIDGLCKNILCPSIVIVLKKDNLIELESPKCKIVRYSKKYNSFIRKKCKEFPTCEEIDRLLEHNSCENITYILYELLNRCKL